MMRDSTENQNTWLFPAILSVLFAAFSIFVVVRAGLFGFWANHVTGYWGNQIWIDLLLALGMVWALTLPRARAVGMKMPAWLLFIVCSGSIGALAMVARLLFLESRRAA